jgi:carboxymethylenebutenolidase
LASSWETVKVGDKDMEVYASLPSGPGPFAAVVVSQHGGGVDQFIRDMADNLAGEGYAAVAPNLFHRYTEDMLADRAGRIQHLSDPEIVADISATVNYLQAHSAVDGERIGITGFCMGGRVTWLAAASNPHFKAAVPYYGGNLMVTWGAGKQTPFEMTANIQCPVLFHFGELDENPSGEDKFKLDTELTRLDKPHQFYTYPSADHAFMDYTGPRYNKEASEMSWPRTIDFFSAHLAKQD